MSQEFMEAIEKLPIDLPYEPVPPIISADGQARTAVAVKPEEPPVAHKLVIMASSGDLERMWATLILANTSAAMGQDTTVFFTFWGLFPLVKNSIRITGENWMQRMLSTLNRGGISHLKTSKLNFAGLGPSMMRSLAKKHNVSSPEELLDMAREMGVHLVPCQMTMDMMGLSREDLIDGLEEPAGATTALLACQGAATLFV